MVPSELESGAGEGPGIVPGAGPGNSMYVGAETSATVA